MRLSNDQLEQLKHIVETELQTQELLAKARLKAAEAVDQQLEQDTPPSREQLQFIRVALQFLARPFRPLDIILRQSMRTHNARNSGFGAADFEALLKHAAG